MVKKEILNEILQGDKMSARQIRQKYKCSIPEARIYAQVRKYRYEIAKSNINVVNSDSRVLIIGDLHLPFEREGYFEHCVDTYNKYNCNQVVFIGDILDNHFSSFHTSSPDGMGAGDEFKSAVESLKKWYNKFPNSKVCLGNHDNIPARKAFEAGLSESWVKSIKEAFNLETWDFADSFIIDNVLYQHGLGGKAQQRSKRELISIVQGHYHTDMYVHYTVGKNFKIFGMQVGCGVDQSSYAMAYGKYFPRPALGCGVVLENGTLPIIEPMKL